MYVKTKQAEQYYGVTIDTLRNWSNNGKLTTIRTKGGHRRYFIPNNKAEKIIYARVSSTKQNKDLKRQIKYLKQKYPKYTIVSDIGSGINFKRKGFQTILDKIFEGNVSEVVVASKDRFSRFGYELFESIFTKFGAKLTSIANIKYKSPEQELSEDLLSIITVFSSRYYGKRNYTTRNTED